jgi:hypothetical protein
MPDIHKTAALCIIIGRYISEGNPLSSVPADALEDLIKGLQIELSQRGETIH